MDERIALRDRTAFIGAMAENAPKGSLKRTALMKCFYFLQTIRNVPLGYHFTLYSYGPYDSGVLNDLEYADVLGVVEVNQVHYPGGYGYDIRTGSKAQQIKESRAALLSKYKDDINWVLKEFGELLSAQLELASTIVYADRESPVSSQMLVELAHRVREVKPHFTEEQVLSVAKSLNEKGLLNSIRAYD